MGKQTGRIVVSLFLILVGAAALLNTLGVVRLPVSLTGANVFWLVVFGIAGIVFLAVFVTDNANWWAIIPGLTMIGLAILVGDILPRNMENLGAAIFMGLLALSFLIILLVRKANWWAIIPGGAILSVAVMIGFSNLVTGPALVAILFFGMAITFVAVYLLPNPIMKMRWALYPAVALAVLGFIFLISSGSALNLVAAAALVVVGVYIIARSVVRHT
jgi:hypothetical protein